MMNQTKKNVILLLTSLFFMSVGCSKEITTQNAKMNISTTIDGVEVFINYEIIAPHENITKISVNWGDDKIENLSLDNLEASHYYAQEGEYEITITARNESEEIINKVISVKVAFKETSLENIKPSLFKSSENEYLILTINLHTYQEPKQNEKFNLIVDLIGKLDIDFIAFQECAQNKSSLIEMSNIRVDNMALIIKNLIKEKYGIDFNYVWDWTHYGWNVWEEGIAILSKHPILDTDQRYISSNTSTSNITSRKAIYGSYQVKNGIINFFSTHTHWRTSINDKEQNDQIKNIKQMVTEKEALFADVTTFVCGDFNGNPTSDYPWSEGYNTMIQSNEYIDTFLEKYKDANNKPAQSIYNTIGGDFPGRIDYIFMKKNSQYIVSESQIIFKDSVVGRVSDHFGVLTKVIDMGN